jgi:hypothetical protein
MTPLELLHARFKAMAEANHCSGSPADWIAGDTYSRCAREVERVIAGETPPAADEEWQEQPSLSIGDSSAPT